MNAEPRPKISDRDDDGRVAAARPLDATLFRTLLAFGAVAVLALALWRLRSVTLLGFAAVLLAVVLHKGAKWVARRSPMGRKAGVGAVVATVVAALGAIVWLLGPRIAAEFGTLATDLPSAIDGLVARMEQTRWGEFVLRRFTPAPGDADMGLLQRLGGTLGTMATVLANVILVVAAAIFLALDPYLYRDGALRLAPPPRRDRLRDVADEIGDRLGRWLGGQVVIMAIVAVLVATGLWFVGVPLPLALGLIAGITNFIPFVGAFIGAAPAILIAFSVSPMTAVYTVVVFLVVQQVEGNLLLPTVQRRAASLPPALTIFAVVVAGVLFGPMGILLATPLLVVVLVAVRRLYVEDALGDRPDDAEA